MSTSGTGKTRKIQIPDPVVVGALAAVLHEAPAKIIAELMELGQFENVHATIDFDTASRIARKHGYCVGRAGPLLRNVRFSRIRAKVQQKIRFGPFRTAHFRHQVDARFRRAFYCYLDQQVMPFLERNVVRIVGRVFSHYDRPQFSGIPEVRNRYYYELSFYSAAGTEEAQGEVDYDPVTEAWTPSRLKPLKITTLSEKLREKREQDLQCQISVEARKYAPVCPAKCPRCGSDRVAAIQYGHVLISPQFERDLRAGRVVLGGCIVSTDDSDPTWCCLGCDNRWGLSARGRARREILKRMGEGQNETRSK